MLKSREVIKDVEASFDVNSLRYNGLRIWPLVRFNLITMLERPEYGAAQEKPRGDLSCESVVPDHDQLAELREYRGVEFMFVSRSEEHGVKILGREYNRWLDPYIEMVRDNHSFVKTEMLTHGATVASPRSIPTVFLKASEGCFHIPDPEGCIPGFEELGRTVRSMCDVDLDVHRIAVTANAVNQYRLYYLDVLSEMRPKVAVSVCYYGAPAMGLIWACRDLGITSVDLQHGYHAGHLYYEDWSCLPAEGYELLPDIFHVWSDSCKEDIEKSQQPECRRHKAIVGNNAWMRRAVRGELAAEQLASADVDFLNDLERQRKVMLVTLQPLPDPMPGHLLEAMKNLPEDWLWLIRCHPGHVDRKAEAIRMLDRAGITNYEIENATTCPLFLLLERCHHHLTAISSVCLEALLFGVPTTFLCQEAYDRYGRHIDAGFFNCAASSSDDLKRFLSCDYDKGKVQSLGSHFFNMNEDVGREAFEQMLRYSARMEFRPIRENLRAVISNKAGLQFAEQGDMEKALRSFWSASRADASSTDYLNNVASLLWSLGRGEDAGRCIETALRINPADDRTIKNCNKLVEAGIHVELPACSSQSRVVNPVV